jgi:DNA polymerase I-like protein with 3'-5' exonuclease and polymerase domains
MSLFDDPRAAEHVIAKRREARLKKVKPSGGGLFADVAREEYRATSAWSAPEPPSLAGVQHVDLDTESLRLKPWQPGARLLGISCSFGRFDPALGRAGLNEWCAARDRHRSYYLPIAHMGGGNLDEAAVRRWAQAELRGKDLYFAKAKHDVQWFLSFGVDLEAQGNRVHDVQHMSALLDEKRRRHNLDDLGAEHLGLPKARLARGSISGDKANMIEKTAAEVGPYAERDAWLVGGLRDAFLPRIHEEGLRRVYDLESRLIWPVVEMERNGARMDVGLLERWLGETQREYERLLDEILRFARTPVNPDSTKDMDKLFKVLRRPITFPVDEETGEPTETPSFADTVLMRIERGPFPDDVRACIGACRRAKAIRSLRSKYLLKYQKHLGGSDLLRYELNQLAADDYGTVTGRFSSSNPNIQQVFKPSKQRRKIGVGDWIIRELFVPEPGFGWMSPDARQIELRMAAHYAAACGMRRLAQIYEKDPDVDFHDVVMGFVGLPRDITKNYSFMKLFGGGVTRGMEMAEESGFPKTEQQVRDELDQYDRLFPEFKRIMEMTEETAETRGFVKTILGRRRRYADEKNPRYYSALNAVIQGSAGDINKIKICEAYEAHRRGEIYFKLMMTVHDEIGGNAPRDPENTRRIKALLDRQSVQTHVPIKWDVKEPTDTWAGDR